MFSLPIGDFENDQVLWVKTAKQAAGGLRVDRPTTTADDCGSLTCWVQNGIYHAEFARYHTVRYSCDAKTKKELREFLERHWWVLTQWDEPVCLEEKENG